MPRKKAPPIAFSSLDDAHSDRGPSGGDRWLYRPANYWDPTKPAATLGCPRSVALCKGQPDSESVYAAEGTAAHWVSELCRINGLSAKHYQGYTDDHMPHPDGGTFTCGPEMVSAVQMFLDYCNARPATAAFFEPKLTYLDWVERDGFGTADDVRIDEDSGTVYLTDLKYGMGVKVSAQESVQLLLYALGVIETYGSLYAFDRFVLSICQPRLDHIDEWEVSRRDIEEWGNVVVRPGAELTLTPDAPIAPGAWCRWCRIRSKCRARARFALDTVGGDNGDDETLSFDDIALLLPHLDTITAWVNDIKDAARTEVARGGRVGGWYLGEGRGGNRTWTDLDALEVARKNHKIRATDLYPRKPVSPSQFEKLFGKDHFILRKFVTRLPGKPTLVAPDSGVRAWAPDPATEFNELDLAEFDGFDGFDGVAADADYDDLLA